MMLLKKLSQKKINMNILIHICRLFYYGFNLVIMYSIALLLMAPFVKVSSPQSTNNTKK